MKIFKNIAITLLVSFLLISVYSIIAKADSSKKKDILYTNSNFSTQADNLNLIVNTISTNNNNLVIDSYLLNTTSKDIKSIKNFNLTLKDANGAVVTKELFTSIPIEKPLKALNGVRVLLTIPLKDVNLANKDFVNISYNFTFDYEN